MTRYPFKENIKRCMRVLKEDLFLTESELEDAFKIVDKVNFVGRPSVIAVSIIYQEFPDLYDLILFTGNITSESLSNTLEKLKKIEL